MEIQNDYRDLLDLMARPGFCVQNDRIVRANAAARALLFTEGLEIPPMLETGKEEYAALTDGCLCLNLRHRDRICSAMITRVGDQLVFLPEESTESLRSMALAAQELREPLSNVMIAAQRLLPELTGSQSEQGARLNRGLHRLLRIVGNMSGISCSRMETRNLPALIEEVFRRAELLVSGVHLTYEGPAEEIYGLADGDLLERAIFNILSNAVKFTQPGGTIDARLVRCGRMLRLTVTDSGSGIREIRSIFSRYLRQPAIEDSRQGIGLGLVMIQAAARNHGGAVLIDRPGAGTRVTLTLAIRQDSENRLRSPRMRVDYAGEQDHGLIELADCLPPELYRV